MRKIRFIIVGLGNRGVGCFAKGLLGLPGKGRPEFAERAEITALVDSNPLRGKAMAAELKLAVPVCGDIASAQRAAPADWAIITTIDRTHCEVVIAALEAGLNVVVDKPLATSAWECDQVIAAMLRTGREVRVGHNMRYSDWALATAKLVRGGRIGRVVSVEAAEILDLSHGGDYFHRWHSEFRNSAGLMSHKCCHQLDIINWILDDEPVAVSAQGGRSFYVERPDLQHGERCLDCGIKAQCPHRFDMDKWDGVYRRMYREAEPADGYVRDRCVFSERHTINDHENVLIRYRRGTLASFTLVTFAPREYSYFNFTGTLGRIETGHDPVTRKAYLRIFGADGSLESPTFAVDTVEHEHGHGGADMRLIADILGLPGSEPLQRAVPEEARRAVLIADLAARSIAASGRPVKAEEAGRDFPPAPR